MSLSAIEPDRLQEIITEVAREESDRYEAALKDAIEEGWMVWQLNKPADRLRGYESSTFVQDIPWVLTEGYLDLYKEGLVPQLQAVTVWQQLQQQSQQTGIPIMDTQMLFWGLLTILPKWIFERFQKDFAGLLKEQIKGEKSSLPLPPLGA